MRDVLLWTDHRIPAGIIGSVQHHEVAHRGEIGSRFGFILELAGNLGHELAVFRRNPVQVFVLRDDSPRVKSLL